MKINEIKEQKKHLRQQLKSRRNALESDYLQSAAQAISQQVMALPMIEQAKQIFIYLSYQKEVDTRNLIDALLAAGKTLAVPKILSKTEMIAVRFTDWNGLEPAELGILTPGNSTPLEGHFDVSLTPGLGFGLDGSRIGFGAGYYDRWFSNNSVSHKIGLAYECQIEATLPRDEYDQMMDIIITDERVLDVKH